MRNLLSRFAGGLALGLLFSMAVASAEEDVALDKVPKPVLDAVKARFADAKLTGASKEKDDDGKLVYEVTLKHKEQKFDVTLTPEGQFVEIEKQITAKDLPEPVTKVLEEKYPKATYRIIEEIVKAEKKEEKLAYYEVLLLTTDKKAFEVQVTAEGKIVNVEKKGSDKDDDD